MAQLAESRLRPHIVNQHDVPAVGLIRRRMECLNNDEFKSFLCDKGPFPAMGIAVEALRRHVSKSAYNTAEGIEELRQAICHFHRHFDNINFDADDVIVGSGSKALIMLLMLIFNGDIMISSSSSASYKAQAVVTGHTPVIIDTREENSFRITPESIRQAIREKSLSHNKLLILKNPCHKTGTYYSEEHLKKLTEVCRQHNIIVVSDEIYARLRYHGNHTSLCQFYPEGTILSTGVSKWANVGGWRIGFNMYPKPLAHLLTAVKAAADDSYSCAPAPMQYAFAEVLQNVAACEDYIQHTTRIMEAVGSFCARHLQSVGVRVSERTCGYYIFANFDVISRAALHKRGVVACKAMCDLMLAELSFAMLPQEHVAASVAGGLTVSLCLANCDGVQALTESYRRGLTVPLDDTFVEEFCSTMHATIMVLKNWVLKLQEEEKSECLSVYC